MQAMPRPRPPHLHRETTRHGRTVWYVRVDKGARVRLHGDFGSEQFKSEYDAAVSGKPLRGKRAAVGAGTLAWLIARYRETSAWLDLSMATRRQRENIFKHVIASAGAKGAVDISKAAITAGRDRRAKTPAQARNFLDAMRGLFRWAVEAQHVAEDPTVGVRNPSRPKTGGFPVWSEEDVAKYEARWPIGTKERVWLDMLLYTGLRRGDVVVVGRQHIRDGAITLRTEKSGEMIELTLPVLPILARTLAVGPCGDLAFICGVNGTPLKKESWGNFFREACRAAGVQKSAHGVRKIAATRAADSGATEAQLEAIFGWHGGQMAALYTRAANRKRLSKAAMHTLANDQATSIPAPDGQVRASDQD
jgi:integrase